MSWLMACQLTAYQILLLGQLQTGKEKKRSGGGGSGGGGGGDDDDDDDDDDDCRLILYWT
jgi:hypothetical protein